jgi:hypothetical protein
MNGSYNVHKWDENVLEMILDETETKGLLDSLKHGQMVNYETYF